LTLLKLSFPANVLGGSRETGSSINTLQQMRAAWTTLLHYGIKAGSIWDVFRTDSQGIVWRSWWEEAPGGKIACSSP